MKTATPPPKHTTCSACSQLAELALLIDALPAKFRSRLIEAALKPNALLHNDIYLVGELRSLIFDCVTQLYGQAVARSWFGDHSGAILTDIPNALRDSEDPAAMQLAVCDLMEELALSLTVAAKEPHDES